MTGPSIEPGNFGRAVIGLAPFLCSDMTFRPEFAPPWIVALT